MYRLVLMISSFTLVLPIYMFYFMYMLFLFKTNEYTCMPLESFAFMQFILWTLFIFGICVHTISFGYKTYIYLEVCFR